jgi:hypothetical protein
MFRIRDEARGFSSTGLLALLEVFQGNLVEEEDTI